MRGEISSTVRQCSRYVPAHTHAGAFINGICSPCSPAFAPGYYQGAWTDSGAEQPPMVPSALQSHGGRCGKAHGHGAHPGFAQPLLQIARLTFQDQQGSLVNQTAVVDQSRSTITYYVTSLSNRTAVVLFDSQNVSGRHRLTVLCIRGWWGRAILQLQQPI